MKNLILSYYEYTFWADEQLFDCVAVLDEAQFKADRDYSRGAIWKQCLHMYTVEHWWFYFLRTGEMPEKDADYAPTLDWLRGKWAQNRDVILTQIRGMGEVEMMERVKPPHWDEDAAPVEAWQAMLQVANHSTDHRAQILRMLYDLGAPTFEQDYLNYLDSLA